MKPSSRSQRCTHCSYTEPLTLFQAQPLRRSKWRGPTHAEASLACERSSLQLSIHGEAKTRGERRLWGAGRGEEPLCAGVAFCSERKELEASGQAAFESSERSTPERLSAASSAGALN